MKVAITGSSGLIGTALRASLHSDGHRVLRLVHGRSSGPDQVTINPRFPLDPRVLDDVDVVVNLAGAGLADKRWDDSYRKQIRASRVQTTESVVRALQSAAPRSRTLVSGSATGWYGEDHGDTVLTEDDGAGSDFLAQVCLDWEAAASPAVSAGVRVVLVRTGIVVSEGGGALEPLLKIFRLGLGGRIGSGDQYWPTITVEDHVRAMRYLMSNADASGAFNLTAPEPPTNREFTAALGRVLHRLTPVPVPPFALRAVLGEFASTVVASARVVPRRLQEAGFTFHQPEVRSQLESVLGH